ncbi:AAA family ATPase [Micromonospora sp. WMMA1363]|uniref:helix-turn-helix transcriptional regulator n=1 Tax=Micromonospora sp. WMMA1363 TaxID=3053985 RepID=UPI00259C7AE5|nr:AAA family ATPase [Micromonospora sp. WMMA1363]MDM4722835.1 AAA family ATPase [Micromonospora sp. WMMA1363]
MVHRSGAALSTTTDDQHAATSLSAAAPLVGRCGELDVFRLALDRARAGRTQVLVVTGEPGIGKSRLLTEFRHVGAEQGFRVLAGRGYPLYRRSPHAPLLEALAEIDHPAVVGAAGQPAPSGSAAGAAPGPQHTDQASHAILARLVGDGAAPASVLLLDDMHHADDDTTRLIGGLVRETPRLPLVVVLAYRQRQAPLRLHTLLADSRTIRHLHLGPISEDDAAALIGGGRSRSTVRELYDASHGIPLYLESLARLGHRPGQTTLADSPQLLNSANLRMLSEVEQASTGARRLAHAAAVAGAPFSADLLAEVTGHDERHIVERLDELIALDLVRPTRDGRHYGFRHPLLCQALYQDISPGQRIALHARTTEVLRRRGASATALAHHLQHAARRGDLVAVAVLERAAATARRVSLASSVAWLRAALRLLPADTDRRRRATLLVSLAEALGLSGQLEASREVMHEALELLPATPADPRARAMAFCVLIERLLLRRAEADALLRAELSGLHQRDGMARAILLFERASGELSAGEIDAGRANAVQVLCSSRRHRVRPYQAAALGLLAMADAARGDLPAAGRHLDRAANLLDAMLNGEFTASHRAAISVVWGELLLERWDNGLRHLERALASAARAEQSLVLHPLYLAKVIALRSRGRLGEATDVIREALALAQRSGSGEQYACALALQRWVGALTGDDAGLPHAGPAEAHLPGVDQWKAMLARRMLADAYVVGNDPAAATALVERAGGLSLDRTEHCSRPVWAEIMTRAALTLGQLESAQAWADRAEETAEPLGLPGRTGLALLARAQVAAARGDAGAYHLSEHAAATLNGAGLVLDAARAVLVGGTVLAVEGQSEQAAADLKAAELAFEEYGAVAYVKRARLERRRLAARVSRRRQHVQQTGVASLTRRERQVAALVSEGLTNRHIAQRLFVTEKTVEMHLANIFTKLNVTSRVAVARFVAG